MLTLKDWMEVVDHRITEGSDYGWTCFGHKAYSLSSWNEEQDGYSFNIVFDTGTQVVYCVEACDYKNDRAYRIINPEFKAAYDAESKDRSVLANQAWDDVNYTDLETDEDFIQKCYGIKSGEDYDTRISIPLDLPDDVLFELMQQAHEQDITLNQHMENIVRSACDEALKLALERLQARTDTADLDAIAAINEALANPKAFNEKFEGFFQKPKVKKKKK